MKNNKLRIKPLCVAAALSAVGLGLGLHQEYATALPGKHNKVTVINKTPTTITVDSYTYNRRGVPVEKRHNRSSIYESSKSKYVRCNRRKSKRNNNIDYCQLAISATAGYNFSPTICKGRNGKTYEIVVVPGRTRRKLACKEL